MADKIEDELRALHLLQARHEVSQLQGKEQMRKTRVQAIENALRADKQRTEATISRCAHRKGGKGVEMIYRGNDSNYAVIKHQLPHGPIIVICQRCPKVWYPPDAALIAKGATTEQRRQYRRELEEYTTALNYPTDNEMSGSQLFVVTRNDDLAEAG
jgi:hypothetical protein